MHRAAIHTLSLVFTPLSNQECEWMRDDEEVRNAVSGSHLYMIGQRRELKFCDLTEETDGESFTFGITDGITSIRSLRLPINQFPLPDGFQYRVDLSDTVFRIYMFREGTDPSTGELFHWFTPHRLAFYYWRGEVIVDGFNDYRLFTEFKLHYVGISKERDSFSRLFETAHENRSRILGNESQLVTTARLTDELTIFLFDVTDLQITSYGIEDSAEDFFREKTPLDPRLLVADAEKALISILRAKYNRQTYASYPKSDDGLWKIGLDKYIFVVNECISFVTSSATIKGAMFYDFDPNDQPDMIAIEGETVELIKP